MPSVGVLKTYQSSSTIRAPHRDCSHVTSARIWVIIPTTITKVKGSGAVGNRAWPRASRRTTHVVKRSTGLGGPVDGVGGEVAGSLEDVLHRLDNRAGQRVSVEVHHGGDEVRLADHLRNNETKIFSGLSHRNACFSCGADDMITPSHRTGKWQLESPKKELLFIAKALRQLGGAWRAI